MTEMRTGSVGILNREEPPASTSTELQLEPVAKEIRIGSGIKDGSITVIENPSLDGYVGLLLSKHFYEARFQWRDLIDVLYIRVDDKKRLRESREYGRVSIDKGFDNIPYNFVATDSGVILPAKSTLPYEICFISPDEYDHFHDELQKGPWETQEARGLRRGRNVPETSNVEHVVESMYKLLAQKVSTFSLDNGKLVLPRDYASLRA